MEGILVCLLALIILFLPTILLLEIGHWVTHSQTISHPFTKCLALSTAFGMIFTLHGIYSAEGEKGLVAVAIAPFIVIVFSFCGLLLGWVYKARGKPFFVRKPKQPIA